MMFCLPHDPYQSTIDRVTSLIWLSSHRTVPDDLVSQCLSDLPGTPVSLPKDEWDSGWMASNKRERQRQQFVVHCHTLLSLMPFEDPNLNTDPNLKDIDLEKLLVEKLPDRTEDTNEVTLPPIYEKIDPYFLPHAIQRADEHSYNALSAYFCSLAKDLSGSQQLLSENTDFGLVKNLLRILILLWYGSDFKQAQRRGDISNIDIKTNPAAQSFYYLEELLNRLLDQSQQNTNNIFQARYSSIVDILASDFNDTATSFFELLVNEDFSDSNVTKVITAAQRFVEYNSNDLAPPDDADLTEHKRLSKIQRLTKVFWDIATPIFQSDAEKHPNVPAKYCMAFLAAIETVLQVGIRTSSRYVYYEDWRYRYLPVYIIRHRSHLPEGFISTLRKASEEYVIDMGGMLSKFDELPEALQGIREESKFWRALEPIQPKIDQAPEPEPEPAN